MPDDNRNLASPGFIQGLYNRVRLVARLMADGRINPLLKLLPVASLVYLVVPTDLMPLIPLDDAAVLWLGSSMFLELCPPEIVQEHWDKILKANNVIDPPGAGPTGQAPTPPDVVDAEFHEVDQP